MKKIITAINNPKLNEELKKEKKFEIMGKDIQYREAILEILEEDTRIDLIIISEQISGEISFEKLLEKIKIKNEEIKIIFILEKQNHDLEKILIKNNILDIYYNNKINLEELIKIINKKEINMEEEIIKLKKIIQEKDSNIKKEEKIKKDKKIFFKDKQKKKKTKVKKQEKRNDEIRNMSTKIITFSGNHKSGKTSLSLIISQCLAEKNYKVLLIDGDLEKKDLNIILKREVKMWDKKNQKYNNKFNNKRKIRNRKRGIKGVSNLIRKTRLIDKKIKNNYEKIENIIRTSIKQLNDNLYFFPALEKIINHKKEKNIYYFFKCIKQNYDFIIVDLSKSNPDKINKEILRNSYTNFMVLEANLLGIKEVHRLLEVYVKDWRININSLHIVKNKKNFITMNRKLVSKYLSFRNKIFEVKENKFFALFMNHYFKRKILLKNKMVKRDLNKIVNKIILN